MPGWNMPSKENKQVCAELGQAQHKLELGLGFTKFNISIDEQKY